MEVRIGWLFILPGVTQAFQRAGIIEQSLFVIFRGGCERCRRKICQTYLLWRPGALAHVLAALEQLEDLLYCRLLLLELLHLQALTAPPGLLDELLVRLLDELNVLDAQLLTDDVEITNWVDVTLDVDDLGVVETPHDLEDGIDGADVRQEGITKTGTGGGASRQTSNVIDSQVGGDDGFGLVVLHQPVEALVRHNDACLLGVNGGIWEIGRVTQRALGDGLEQCRLADVCKANLATTVNVRT